MVALVMICMVIIIFKLIFSFYRRENRYEKGLLQLFICSGLILLFYGGLGDLATVISATADKNMSKFKKIKNISSIKTDSITRTLSSTDFDLLQKIEKSGGTKYKFQQYYYEGTYTESTILTWPLQTSYDYDPSIKHWELVLPK